MGTDRACQMATGHDLNGLHIAIYSDAIYRFLQ